MLGIDLVKTARIERMMERFGDKALQKFLHPDEIKLVKNANSAAGFWATKEAVSKALGVGIGSQCSFFDIKLYKDKFGAPKVALSRQIVETFNIENATVSITHDGEYAISVVVLQSTTTDKIEQF
jgi:holo-[acyl-carrier protein] synthase